MSIQKQSKAPPLSLRAAAQYACVSPGTIRRAMKKGLIKSVVAAHTILFEQRDVETFLQQRRQKRTTCRPQN
jgi:predicted site-specific integrase-resolvase